MKQRKEKLMVPLIQDRDEYTHQRKKTKLDQTTMVTTHVAPTTLDLNEEIRLEDLAEFGEEAMEIEDTPCPVEEERNPISLSCGPALGFDDHRIEKEGQGQNEESSFDLERDYQQEFIDESEKKANQAFLKKQQEMIQQWNKEKELKLQSENESRVDPPRPRKRAEPEAEVRDETEPQWVWDFGQQGEKQQRVESEPKQRGQKNVVSLICEDLKMETIDFFSPLKQQKSSPTQMSSSLRLKFSVDGSVSMAFDQQSSSPTTPVGTPPKKRSLSHSNDLDGGGNMSDFDRRSTLRSRLRAPSPLVLESNTFPSEVPQARPTLGPDSPTVLDSWNSGGYSFRKRTKESKKNENVTNCRSCGQELFLEENDIHKKLCENGLIQSRQNGTRKYTLAQKVRVIIHTLHVLDWNFLRPSTTVDHHLDPFLSVPCFYVVFLSLIEKSQNPIFFCSRRNVAYQESSPPFGKLF
jgi:hypothetical protein